MWFKDHLNSIRIGQPLISFVLERHNALGMVWQKKKKNTGTISTPATLPNPLPFAWSKDQWSPLNLGCGTVRLHD